MSLEPNDPRRPVPDAPPAAPAELAPLAVPTLTVIRVGAAVWALALVATFVVPAWHTGERSWWPWTCIVGLALAAFGEFYVRRGRGNAADA